MRTRVLYDGRCPMCRRYVERLRRLDWLGRLDYLDANRPDLFPADLPPVDPARLQEEMHVVTSGGVVLAGFHALRHLAWLLPLGWIVVLFLYFPGVPTLGQWLYRKVARNRARQGPCTDDYCTLPPQGTQARNTPQAADGPNRPPGA